MRKFSTASLLTLLFALLVLARPAYAESSEFKSGMKALNAHQYAQAMGFFMQAGMSEPDNPQVHYYLGRSYEGVNQPTLAKQEYVYVLKSSANAKLKEQANASLFNLVHETMGTKSGAAPTRLAAAPPKGKGKLHILFFTADW